MEPHRVSECVKTPHPLGRGEMCIRDSDRNGEDDAAEPAESHIGHGARGPAVILAEQIGIGNDDRDSDQNQRVEKRAADDGIDHQAAGFFGREVEFFSGLGDRVETHEQPRGNGEDGRCV